MRSYGNSHVRRVSLGIDRNGLAIGGKNSPLGLFVRPSQKTLRRQEGNRRGCQTRLVRDGIDAAQR